MKQRLMRTMVSITKTDQICVVREECFGQIWKPLGRYITTDLYRPPMLGQKFAWATDFVRLLMTAKVEHERETAASAEEPAAIAIPQADVNDIIQASVNGELKDLAFDEWSQKWNLMF